MDGVYGWRTRPDGAVPARPRLRKDRPGSGLFRPESNHLESTASGLRSAPVTWSVTPGICAADLATRRRFATDLLNLTLAGPRVNRYDKVDRDAAEWLPAQNRCWFAARVIAVRQRYGLTIDRREADALDQISRVARFRPRPRPRPAFPRQSPRGTITGTAASVARKLERTGSHR